MKFIDFLSIFFILIMVLVGGHFYLTWKGSKVADEYGQYDLRTTQKQ